MSERRMISEEAVLMEVWDGDNETVTLGRFLENIESSKPDENVQVHVRLESGNGGGAALLLKWERPETDEERDRRLKNAAMMEADRARRMEISERATYERLKEKYEGIRL